MVIKLLFPATSFSKDTAVQRIKPRKVQTSRPLEPEQLRPPVPDKYKSLRNPLPRNPENLLYGEILYDINCSICHGGNLDGRGPEADGLFPQPANLIDLVTTVRPKEVYLFWRIKEGGPGLPKNWGPWNSAMPVWQDELRDEEIWQIILYLYEAAGEVAPL